MVDIKRAVEVLSRKRKIFHSEADFKHALAWEINKQWKGCSMRLEFRPSLLKKRIYIDIWCSKKQKIIGIELKHKTRKFYLQTSSGEVFDLLNQSAQDIARYDFLKDVQRLELLVSMYKNATGYAIFLTNDRVYWNPPGKKNTFDTQFRLHNRRSITGNLKWEPGTSEGTMRGRKEPITIRGKYKFIWQEYSQHPDKKWGEFKFLLLEIKSKKN